MTAARLRVEITLVYKAPYLYWLSLSFDGWVVKVAQPCNLVCLYCYVYELLDRTWRMS